MAKSGERTNAFGIKPESFLKTSGSSQEEVVPISALTAPKKNTKKDKPKGTEKEKQATVKKKTVSKEKTADVPLDVPVLAEAPKPQMAYVPIIEPERRERKEKRIQILTKASLVKEMDDYAARKGVSRAVVFETAVSQYLNSIRQK